MTRQDNFTSRIKIKLAERAAYMCSNPACMRITVGSCDADPNESTKTGKAAHICAASPNGPRYDSYQSPSDRKSIKNALWLCGSCADLIDKNNGQDYSVSGFNPLRKLSPLGIQVSVAERLVKLLESKGVLFVPYSQEDQDHVVRSLSDLRDALLNLREEVQYDSPLDLRIKAMIDACRYYMNHNKGFVTMSQLEESLGELRKVFGIHLKQMKEQYNLNIGSPLSSIFPQPEI